MVAIKIRTKTVSTFWLDTVLDSTGYCDNICLRISRALAVKKFCPKLWNARTSNEVQHVENWQIFFNNLSTFKIDLRKLWNQRPVRSFRRAHRRRKMGACMMLKSTETIAIEDAFPSRAALLLRRFFHNIRYNLCVWRRSWRWVRRCPATPWIMVPADRCWRFSKNRLKKRTICAVRGIRSVRKLHSTQSIIV